MNLSLNLVQSKRRRILTGDVDELADAIPTATPARWARKGIEIRTPGLLGAKASMAHLVSQLEAATLRPIVDRTGISGEFVYRLRLGDQTSRSDGPQPNGPRGAAPGSPRLNELINTLDKELGLKLEPAKIPGEVFVIEHIERPSEN